MKFACCRSSGWRSESPWASPGRSAWSAFVIVLVLGLVGYFTGRALTGELDLSKLFVTRERRPQ